jgi:hypothetical protein
MCYSHCRGHFPRHMPNTWQIFPLPGTGNKVSFLPQVKDADLGGAEGPRRSRLAHEAGQPGILRWASLPFVFCACVKVFPVELRIRDVYPGSQTELPDNLNR